MSRVEPAADGSKRRAAVIGSGFFDAGPTIFTAPHCLEELYDMIAAIEKRSHVIVEHYRTPETFRDELNAYHGSAFSCAPTLTQSAWFRPHNRDPQIPGLYLVGAGTHPGAGVPGVVNSAKATARVILEDFSP